VRAGSCWRLYSEDFFLSPRVDEHPLPEIQRVALEEVVLQVGPALYR
jgi:HrpA-like RNA helicase